MLEKTIVHRLARLYNVQSTYYDVSGRLIESPPEAILRVLQVLGAGAGRIEDLPDVLRQRRQSLWQRGIDPVLIAWNGGPVKLRLRLPRRLAHARANYQVVLESGEVLEGECRDEVDRQTVERWVEGAHYGVRRLLLAEQLPLGYHRLILRIGGRTFESHLFSAPLQACAGRDSEAKHWGLFCPVYALRSEKNWGAGDFSDLETFVDFTGRLGGHIVGTLPLFAAFLDEPFNPSPYSPVSRLFWNEFFLDVTRIPEWEHCSAARALAQSAHFENEIGKLRAAPTVEYRPIMALKRKVLEAMARYLLSEPSNRQTLFQEFVASHPMAEDYAAYRAKVERERTPWQQWPERCRGGSLSTGDYDDAARQYHLYVQWQSHEQMRALSEKTKGGGPALYLDFPLGVNRDGYDVWRERAAFALEANGGAPPDTFFTKGQDWGFPPLHPEGLRQQGYRYYIQCLRHHLQYAGMLRIDHIMGLHRFYWVPEGFAPSDGVYVRYPAEEFYAVLNLESHRHGAQIVGENLGTVPPYVNAALAKHGIHGMYVGQFGVSPDPENALEDVARGTVASLNTHDTPTFAGFWNEEDIQDRLDLGLLTEDEVAVERQNRSQQRQVLVAYLKSHGWLSEDTQEPAKVLQAWLSHLAKGEASLLLVNLEDLWLEPLPQNVPGTWEERPNWQRKTRHPWKAISRMTPVLETLSAVNAARKE